MLGSAIGIASTFTALAFAYAVYDDAVRYSSLGSMERGRFWFAIGITGVAAALSLFAFIARIHAEPVSPLARATIGSLITALVCGGAVFFKSMPP
jgi:hypothetical protein